ncbi:MAG: Flp pilus assembly protein CpaB [SAR324 cluster bacterium]|uniref:Flp pilus assembly protein CpaB n=1 Tax=SAR324 cluster bacterium TaxID=2024889 RepID=A0A7X9IKW1_9DELT|nr:Flp pilus assembly protein CpaB [SAR324 cluster bacterium]
MAISTKDWKTSDTDFDIAGLKKGSFGGRTKRKNKNAVLALASLAFVLVFVMLVAILLKETSKAKSEVKERVVVVTEPAKEAPVPMANVLVPVQEIEAGKSLDPQMFKMIEKPAMSVSEDAVRSFEEIRNLYPRSILAANQPLVKDLFTAVRPPNQVSAKIPVGFRAVTINVNATSAVEGWANPGANVDVHWVSNITGEQTATLLVQNAKILSAERQVEGQNVGTAAVVPTTVTLLVS